jgi:UPF0755 protein
MTTRNAEDGTRNNRSTVVDRFRVPRSAFAVLVGAWGWACGVGPSRCGGSGDPPCVTVTIPRGATLDGAIDSLVAHGVLASGSMFGPYARSRGLQSTLKSGVYALPAHAGWRHIVAALTSGRGAEARFTVREGLTAAEVAEVAERQLRIPKDSFLAALEDEVALGNLDPVPADSNVEGYLFPTTYVVPVSLGARELVRLMTRQFDEQWRPEWTRRLDTLQLTRHEIVTLASIVEAEVRYPPDREYVAAVYMNRLRRRMPLQADPTVLYAHGRRLPRVWEKHLRIQSPYNTYLHPGLPPGPIGQPGLASLEAALYPKPVGYLYFVAQPDGKHVFSQTYAQHLAAIRTIRRPRPPVTPRRPPPGP